MVCIVRVKKVFTESVAKTVLTQTATNLLVKTMDTVCQIVPVVDVLTALTEMNVKMIRVQSILV